LTYDEWVSGQAAAEVDNNETSPADDSTPFSLKAKLSKSKRLAQ
jgi:hypothetical protein